ncbi:glutamine hydrolyzing CTP synthase [Lebetimonas sp. JS138]|uniref:glutamine hydrolyzing CTP synthase n=1 Tax=Lebetimonas sp. JS138 TaxID=990072 RepID=UPI000467734B|nr:CTP synthase (glutamine hydrolyzing) [Lebetimonas sp. JS138]
MAKFIFVTGGVLSSLGKGITSASIATLLQHSGLKVTMVKIDPYINVDPGTMSPFEHGEVFVTEDGAETDLDVGNYERFLNINLGKKNNFTTGQVYLGVIKKERRGDYLGKTVQIIPHITDEIKKRIKDVSNDADIVVVELGGTVGDIEGLPFLEAVRQLKQEVGKNNAMFVHVTLIPYMKAAGELKTKPTQHSVQELRRIGITPHMIVCRTEKPLPKSLKDKLATSTDIDREAVIEAVDAPTIYQVPLNFFNQDILKPISEQLDLGELHPDMSEWNYLVKKIISPQKSVKIAFVGKYLKLKESYKSLIEALIHSGAHLDMRVEIEWIDSENLEKISDEELGNIFAEVSGILVPGGFGERGVEGKLIAIKYARVNKIPYLGICLGMQLAVIEFARNVLGLKYANSQEFEPDTSEPVVYLIDEFIDANGQKQIRTHKSPLGGTMRLGGYECLIKKDTKLYEAYKVDKVIERHRHRYEVNNAYEKALEDNGMIVSGKSKEGLIEAVELKNHPWFVGVQFHPEFTNKLKSPNKVIMSFVENAYKCRI